MKTNEIYGHSSCKFLVSLARTFIVAGLLLVATRVLAQNAPPVLTVKPTGTSQLSITIANGSSAVSYELWTTPVLANPNYPWTTITVGTNGQTNFTVTMQYPASFYRVILDTNAIPLWEAADPNNPSAGILAVFINRPTDGAVIQ